MYQMYVLLHEVSTTSLPYSLSSLPPPEVATATGLQLDDDLGELEVPLLLQLGQDPRTEEHLGVSDAVRGRIQVQCLQLV